MARYITLSYSGLWLVNVTGTLSSLSCWHVELLRVRAVVKCFSPRHVDGFAGTLRNGSHVWWGGRDPQPLARAICCGGFGPVAQTEAEN